MDEEAARYFKEAAEALRETTRIQREIQQQFAFLHLLPSAVPRSVRRAPASHRGPLNPAHQTWRGFCDDLQKLEEHARREGLKLTRANVCRGGLESPKTLRRTMAWYGLVATAWPPSTWDPNEPREGGAGGKNW
jgi:hypothetical protein